MADDKGPEDDHFTENMKAARIARKWSQGDLAQVLRRHGIESMTHSTISRMESGKRRVGLSEARAIAEVFGTTIDALSGPPEGLKDTIELAKVLGVYRDARTRIKYESRAYEKAAKELYSYLETHPGVQPDDVTETLLRQVRQSAAGVAIDEFKLHDVWTERAHQIGKGDPAHDLIPDA
ncbi:helix-turn-helix transcriptional regulator [Acidipropionibacterium jensenii]|uniref:helix-turn-helix transcriptional regulator n=1 Tax=Acidipropionibacterium jensenii TaxID=1749 RepID=UPI002649133D|nr:helix-turn-helix domain-containing protein [Acidipropionibacterium jensenii]MDN6017677.1 helix-turn-helix domain-containing protein [Bifidobacterium mongoliense]MDN6556376.1 helix-turn-helix domain-containing protein [Acidipropionibacterium acidipropionici]MDN5977993.1 helix-turn-helix domain-containing protein [Acidipropionibacterium jensenii]MDN5996797.1 helix-turn-helix domain-containing protein [Acidipropionibacterium jensenii]MDN6427406.1 helix-turn-helix domain-containing protein [Aci